MTRLPRVASIMTTLTLLALGVSSLRALPPCDGRAGQCVVGSTWPFWDDYEQYFYNYRCAPYNSPYGGAPGHNSQATTTPLGLKKTNQCGTLWYIEYDAFGVITSEEMIGVGLCGATRVLLGGCDPSPNS